MIPIIFLWSVLSTNGVEPPSSNPFPDKKGKGVSLQSIIWNLLRKSPMYMDCVIMIGEFLTQS